ncbi:MAG: PH domain-containing protein [Gammaproteobacteria bacterium]|nr:PH domain-containing protein [Gammaproteobacteria bacterium]MCP4275100.1 PH domain-containing protein [Gammaproteobacteria bacterium]MCP4830974.1 PH domain-containing protein [Gammaproteobacteria bacterium]
MRHALTDISYDAKPAWRGYWLLILFGIATLILTIGVLLIMWAVLDRRGKHYTVNEHKAEAHQGVFTRTTRSLELKNLHKVELTQTIKQKMLGIGTLVLYAKEGDGAELIFQDIAKVTDLKNQLEHVIANSGG